MLLLSAVVVGCYMGFSFFSIQADISRVAASRVGANAAGAAFERMMSTLKRLVMFSYPPLLGVMIYQEDLVALYGAILFSFFGASCVSLFCLIYRSHLERYFEKVVLEFVGGAGPVRSFVRGWRLISGATARDFSEPRLRGFWKRLDVGIFVPAVLIHGVFGVAIFLLNVVAARFVELGPVLFQMLGLVTAVGTLLLAFYLDPILSRRLDKCDGLGSLSISLIVAHLFAYAVVGPVVIGVAMFFIYF